MASFDKYSNYDNDAGVTGVVFGAEVPVLEVELNEMQEIQKTLLGNVLKSLIGNGISDKKAITYLNNTLSISDCFFAVNGYLVHCNGLSISAKSGDSIYLQVWEDTVDHTATLKKAGNEQSTDIVPNYIKDSRIGEETSRRKVVKYTLVTTTDSNKENLPIATISDDGITLLVKEVNLTNLSDRLSEFIIETANTYLPLTGGAIKGDLSVSGDIKGDLIGNAKTATSATSADSATKAAQDGDGNVITDTYAEKETIALKSTTGTSISVADSKEAPMILNSATINLVNIADFTATVYKRVDINLPAGTYKLIYDFETTDAVEEHSWVRIGNDSDIFWSSKFKQEDKHGVAVFSSTTPITRLYFYADSSATTTNATISVSNIMITADLQAEHYVPYTGYDIASCGKNLIGSVPKLTEYETYCSTEWSGDTLTVTSTTSGGWSGTGINLRGLKPSTKYTISMEIEASTTNIHNGIKIGSVEKFGYGLSETVTFTVTANANGKISILFLVDNKGGGSSGDYAIFKNIMLEEGDTASGYEASKSTSVTINSETVFPVNGLESYDGLTNVLNPYSATMEVTYATNEAGQGILKEIETKAEIDGSNAKGDWDISITGNAKTATKATSADSATKATQDASGNVISSTYSKTNHTHNYAGSSSAGGVANSATKLATARTIRTNLSSTSTASFNGSANITPGVTGTLPVANGGTGKTTLVDSANALINALSTGSSDPEDNDYFVSQSAGGKQDTFHRRPVSALWNYIKGKISSVLGLTASNYGGNAKTATSATSATTASKLGTNAGSATNPTYFADGIPKACTYSLNKTVPSDAVFTDTNTKNTAGSTDTSSKIFLIGATSQAANPQTYSHNTAYVGTDGCLYSNSTKVSVSGHTHNYAGSSSAGGAATTALACTGNSATATKATQDASGNVIADTYAKKSIYNDTVVSMGRASGSTVGEYSFAFGDSCEASGYESTVIGQTSVASGSHTCAIGRSANATGNYAYALGFTTTASDTCAIAIGTKITALKGQTVIGHYNDTKTATASTITGTSTGTAFVIGNGGSSNSNAFRVRNDGYVYATNATVQTGADYAEYFEWADKNQDKEDRVGYFVTFDEDNQEKIRIANEDDYILGIVSGMPSVIGNGDECWKQRYILDDFGRYIEETFEYEEEEIDQETGETKIVVKTGTKWRENPEYDNTQPYIPRDERAEWSAIGMLGVLSVRDDGTCQVNGYCKCTDGGIATACEKGEGYRIIKRVTDNVVKIILK